MTDVLIIIGENVRKYRESKGLTQRELAELAGLHRNYVGSVENGNRNLSVTSLEKISKALNVDIQRLLDETIK